MPAFMTRPAARCGSPTAGRERQRAVDLQVEMALRHQSSSLKAQTSKDANRSGLLPKVTESLALHLFKQLIRSRDVHRTAADVQHLRLVTCDREKLASCVLARAKLAAKIVERLTEGLHVVGGRVG